MTHLNNKNKKLFVLWSGGADSTFLIEQALKHGNYKEVHAGYVEIKNNKGKTKMELDAIKKIRPFFDKYKNFCYDGIVAKIDLETVSGGPVQMQIFCWILGILPRAAWYDEISIGYIMNDDSMPFINEITRSYNSFKFLFPNVKNEIYNTQRMMAKLTFPLRVINKEWLLESMDKDLYKLTVTCENPKNNKACNKCLKCKEKAEYDRKT